MVLEVYVYLSVVYLMKEKEDKLQEVIDDIRNKFGDSVIGFANEKNNK